MATLYELTNEFMMLLDMAEDPDTDPQVFADTMESLEGDLKDKADGYGRVIRQLENDSTSLKAEIARLKTRKDAVDKNVERMKENLKKAMILTSQRKIDTDLFRFSIRKNPERVVLDTEDVLKLPEQYLRYKDPEVDKTALKDDLKAGIDLEGLAHLESSESLIIK